MENGVTQEYARSWRRNGGREEAMKEEEVAEKEEVEEQEEVKEEKRSAME